MSVDDEAPDAELSAAARFQCEGRSEPVASAAFTSRSNSAAEFAPRFGMVHSLELASRQDAKYSPTFANGHSPSSSAPRIALNRRVLTRDWL